MTTVLALLLAIALYLLVGMVLAHHTKIGSEFYPNSLIRLTFFWIVPIVGFVIWVVAMLVLCVFSDILLFGDKQGDKGLSSVVEPT